MKPMVAERQQNGPRTLKWSLSQQTALMYKKAAAYGGADRPLDWAGDHLPISLMIVGTKSGSEA